MSSVREFRFRSPERNRETDERRIASGLISNRVRVGTVETLQNR
jgi:hypothetical protein